MTPRSTSNSTLQAAGFRQVEQFTTRLVTENTPDDLVAHLNDLGGHEFILALPEPRSVRKWMRTPPTSLRALRPSLYAIAFTQGCPSGTLPRAVNTTARPTLPVLQLAGLREL